MSDFKFWGWDKKPRTMLRFVKSGDIFCFRVSDDEYRFGRIISKIKTGHVAEFFDYRSSTPEITSEKISNSKRIFNPVVIDTYTLFDRKKEKGSDWRIIGTQGNYVPSNVENIYFAYGIGDFCKKIDIFNKEISITEDEAMRIPELTPLRDIHIKNMLGHV